ncbi:GNAT family N-acetyltransferase [Bremerella sp. JC770]|uniref:GNAT family N-acetyltransferase n=1 Tax=Bremerella sp. JC770 TaxID=3232137 RepID=UPI00345760E0
MVTIRAAQPSDAVELQALFEQLVSSPGNADFAQTTKGERVYVAVSEAGLLVGAVTVWQPESFIHCLFVDRQFQGQGIGTQLLESLIPWLPFPWKLKCLATNQSALAFYRRHGWKKLETGLGEQGTYFLLGRDATADGTR